MEDYFAFYGLARSIDLDQDALRQRYLQKSKEHHPDFFINDPERYQYALEQTSLNNQAFKALSDPDLRIKHLLELHGLLADSKDSLPGDFLFEMMELNEELADAKMGEDPDQLAAVHQKIDAFANELEEELKALPAELNDTVLGQLKTFYLKRRYLRRIRVQDSEL